MKCAVIDIGTNTVLLLVSEVGKGVSDLVDMSTIVQLGKGLTNTGTISGPAISRTMEALERYVNIANSHKVEKIFCVGTAALREAGNSGDFIAAVRESFGLDVEIISEKKEAYYTYLSVRDDPLMIYEGMTIIDIGGGSTEIIDGDGDSFSGYVSLPLGSVRITDAFISYDPPEREEINRAASHIRGKIENIRYREGSRLVGTGGTATNLAAIILGLEEYNKDRIHGFAVEFTKLEETIEKLAVMDSGRRRMVKGMEPGREDIILQGAVILREIMAHGQFTRCIVSAKGVRYGVLNERCSPPFYVDRPLFS